MTWKLRVFVFGVQVSLPVPHAPRVATCVRLDCSHSHFIFSVSHSSEDVEKPKEKMEVNQQPGYLHWGPSRLESPYPGASHSPLGTGLGLARVCLAPKLHAAYREAWCAQNLCPQPALPGGVLRPKDPEEEATWGRESAAHASSPLSSNVFPEAPCRPATEQAALVLDQNYRL